VLFTKILFATDFSPISERALGVVRELRASGAAEVVLVHVLDERDTGELLAQPSGVGGDPEPEFEAGIRKRKATTAERNIDAVQVQLEKAGYRVRPKLVQGLPDQEILRIAEAEGVGAIVVGAGARGSLRHIIRGSVSENVVRRATQPVLVVRSLE
jgi:nucleotide-binding universal stress UspA family protein